MWIRFLLVLTTYEMTIISLLQSDIISETLWKFLEQYPPLLAVALTAYYLYKMQKDENRTSREWQREENKTNREWLEKMLTTQREQLKEAYESKNMFESTLLDQLNNKQNHLTDRLDRLAAQLEINTATVSEIAKVDSIVQDLIVRLEKK